MKEAAEKAGLAAWIFEEVDELRGAPPQKSQKVCLDNVDASDLYVAVFHCGYGSSAENHLAGISLVDLEFFEAFREQKPIRVYVLEPFNPEPNLAALIQIVRSLVPDSIRICANEKSLVTQFRRDVDSHLAAASPNSQREGERIFGRFLQRLCAFRQRLDLGVGLRFLADRYPPPEQTEVLARHRRRAACQSRFIVQLARKTRANLEGYRAIVRCALAGPSS